MEKLLLWTTTPSIATGKGIRGGAAPPPNNISWLCLLSLLEKLVALLALLSHSLFCFCNTVFNQDDISVSLDHPSFLCSTAWSWYFLVRPQVSLALLRMQLFSPLGKSSMLSWDLSGTGCFSEQKRVPYLITLWPKYN